MNSKKSCKGQSSLEYVMTYGWMIIVVLIVGVLLWQMGALQPPTSSKGCREFSQMTILDWKASASANSLQLVIQNEAGSKMTLDSVGGSVDGRPCNSITAINTEIRPGKTYQATLANCGISGYKPGTYYQANITIVYYNAGSNIWHNSVGRCWGGIE